MDLAAATRKGRFDGCRPGTPNGVHQVQRDCGHRTGAEFARRDRKGPVSALSAPEAVIEPMRLWSQAGVEPQCLVTVVPRWAVAAQRSKSQGAVVKTDRRLRRRADTDAVGCYRVLVTAPAIRTHALVEIRPEALPLESDGHPH